MIFRMGRKDADESAANPVALTDTKLASFGINKNTKSLRV